MKLPAAHSNRVPAIDRQFVYMPRYDPSLPLTPFSPPRDVVAEYVEAARSQARPNSVTAELRQGPNRADTSRP